MYGFGGVPRYFKDSDKMTYEEEKKMVRCWNLLGEPKADESTFQKGFELKVDGKMGALGAYHRAAKGTTFAGPTYFAGILRRFKHAVEYGMEHYENNFFVMCIFTDGSIHDIEDTKELVVQLSYLPVSIIIVGIGEEDFARMVELDADSHVLCDKNGLAAARDIIQFVVFNEMKDLSQERVRAIMMAEVPDQFVEYMVMKNIAPPPPKNWSSINHSEDPTTPSLFVQSTEH